MIQNDALDFERVLAIAKTENTSILLVEARVYVATTSIFNEDYCCTSRKIYVSFGSNLYYMPILSGKNINGLVALEPKFQAIIDQYKLPENWSREEGFQTLSKIILEQQVSLDSALATWNKLVERLGDITPKSILTLDQAAMKSCFVTRQKTKYLHALSDAVLNGSLDIKGLSKLSIEDVQTELIKIKGIGPWTAQVYLIFALRSPDLYPKGDVALNNAVRDLFEAETKEEIYELSEKWAPHRTTASFLLWHQYLSKRGRVWKG